MSDELQELYIFSVKLFGGKRVKKDEYRNPPGIEITIDTSNLAQSPIKKVELSLYIGDTKVAFMLMDDFRFEYTTPQDEPIDNMKAYLVALANGKIYLKRQKFLGITVSSKIAIKD